MKFHAQELEQYPLCIAYKIKEAEFLKARKIISKNYVPSYSKNQESPPMKIGTILQIE